jgi:hypothetical protein
MQTSEKILLQINEQTIKDTIKCSRDFDCLKNENHSCLGNIVSCVSGEVHFVNCTASCKYKIRFGSSPFCSCPTRKAIYNKYGK